MFVRPHTQRVFFVLYICRNLIWGQVEGGNVYLTLLLHGFSHAAHKIVLQENSNNQTYQNQQTENSKQFI